MEATLIDSLVDVNQHAAPLPTFPVSLLEMFFYLMNSSFCCQVCVRAVVAGSWSVEFTRAKLDSFLLSRTHLCTPYIFAEVLFNAFVFFEQVSLSARH